jgi:HEPN domain-containing protein
MKKDELLNYCFTSSEKKFETAQFLFSSRRYSDCLFFCHLSLEMMLKGKFVEARDSMFPLVHDLEFVARKIPLDLPAKFAKELSVINTFNIAARYDDYKLSFYKKATRQFAQKYFKLSKELLVWLKKYTPEKK